MQLNSQGSVAQDSTRGRVCPIVNPNAPPLETISFTRQHQEVIHALWGYEPQRSSCITGQGRESLCWLVLLSALRDGPSSSPLTRPKGSCLLYNFSDSIFNKSFKCKFKTFFTPDVCLHKRTFYILNVLNFPLKMSPSGRASPGFRHMSYCKNYFFPWEIIPDPSGISNLYCFF